MRLLLSSTVQSNGLTIDGGKTCFKTGDSITITCGTPFKELYIVSKTTGVLTIPTFSNPFFSSSEAVTKHTFNLPQIYDDDTYFFTTEYFYNSSVDFYTLSISNYKTTYVSGETMTIQFNCDTFQTLYLVNINGPVITPPVYSLTYTHSASFVLPELESGTYYVTTEYFYYSSKTFTIVPKINGFYWWTYNKDTNEAPIILSTNYTNGFPFAMPKNTIVTYYPSDATEIVPSGTNAIFFFSGFDSLTVCLNNIKSPKPTYYGDLYVQAGNYFNKNKITNYLLGITIGGGGTLWSTEIITQLTSDIQNNVIKYGTYDNYQGDTKYFNTIVIDLEQQDTEYYPTIIEDFKTCFKAIKQMGYFIIVTIAHSGTFYEPNDFLSSLYKLSDVDYFSPQLYTQDFVGCNEYSRTGVDTFYWSDFYKAITQNPNYSSRGNTMILPSLGFNDTTFTVNGEYGTMDITPITGIYGTYNKPPPSKTYSGSYQGLYSSPGTNIGNNPYFEVSSSILNPSETEFPNPYNTTFHTTYPNQNDLGAADFFEQMFMTVNGRQEIGGSIQFANGVTNF